MKWHGRYLQSRNLARNLARNQARKLGQISILMVFSLIPMFTLFAFVINIGMLVNAKIALQNAVDAAAYAGAATQARQMTDISHLNYYMRQVYKKFIFKYYVLGNISQKCFPKSGAGKMAPQCGDIHPDQQKDFDWKNRDSAGGHPHDFPGVPVVCISLSKESNPCQVEKAVPVVTKPKCGIVDPACGALQNAADGIASIQKASCTKSSIVNQEVLGLWLYATDYDRTLGTNANLQGLVSDDIGLMPEELMTLERINNIVDIINTPPVQRVTTASMAAIKTGRNTLSHARTILAFDTMVNNLNTNIFPNDSIEMAELIQTPLLLIKPIEIKNLDVGVTYMEVQGESCGMNLSFFTADVFTGVSKSKFSHVYYAVKGTAKARLLFNPFPFGAPADSITLTAYAAAKPFGSRIGPDLSDQAKADAEYSHVGIAHRAPDFTDESHKYPSVKIDDANHDSASSDVLAGYFNALATDDTTKDGGNSVGSGNVGQASLALGIHAAMIPDEYELGLYNIPVDSDTIGNKAGFAPYFINGTARGDERATYSIWAPFIAEGKPDVFADKMTQEIENITNLATAATADPNDPISKGKAALKANLQGGQAALRKELLDKNAYNVFQMPDPLGTAFYQNHPPPNIPGKVSVKWSTKATGAGPFLATSWVTDRDAGYFSNGRDGYSVKLIALKSLLSAPGKITNDPSGQANWIPLSGAFNGEREDMQKVAH